MSIPGGFLLIFYPLLPWLGVMLVGWAFGRWLLSQDGPDRENRIASRLLVAGSVLLVGFVVQRAVNGYGNYWLDRTDSNPLRWLQVSKYPPSLAFCALELGIMSFCLALYFRRREPVSRRSPLIVFGQTALFFYVVHLGLLLLANYVLSGAQYPPIPDPGWGLSWTYVGTLVALVVIYPLCLAYRSYKHGHPKGWTQFL